MKILYIATAFPEDEYTTEKLLQVFPCSLPESVVQNVRNLGVSKRYLIKHERDAMDERGVIDLCVNACVRVLEKAQLTANDVGYFVAAYDVNPFLSPGLSQLLTRKIGFNAYVKHVNVQGTASTAFPKALEIAENHLSRHAEDSVLICVSGVSSYWFQNQVRGLKNVMEVGRINAIRNKADRKLELQKWVATMQFFLFGDGVAAILVSNEGNGPSLEKTVEVTNVGKKDYLAGYARLEAMSEPFRFGFHSHLGKEIPILGVKYSDLVLKKLLGKNSERIIKTAKKWAIHTGSEKILNRMAEHHRIGDEKLVESHGILREFGNLAGASLPFILERILAENRFTADDVVLMLGYGWGFAASASLLKFGE